MSLIALRNQYLVLEATPEARLRSRNSTSMPSIPVPLQVWAPIRR